MSHRQVIHDPFPASLERLVLQLHPVTADLGEAQDVVRQAFVELPALPGRMSVLDNPEEWLRTVAVPLAPSRRRRGKVLQRLLAGVGAGPIEVPGACRP